MDDNYIPMTSCKHGHLYRLHSRNLRHGVYNAETKGFNGLRRKFDNLFLFEEYHWDTGAPYGTVKPLEDLGMCDVADDQDKLYARLLSRGYKEMQDLNWALLRELARAKQEKGFEANPELVQKWWGE